MNGALPLPRIGLTLDWQDSGDFSSEPWYACRQNYVDAVVRAGGLPCALPHEPALVQPYLATLDGLLVTSGPFDVDPSYYQGGTRHATTITKDRRTAFEFAMIIGALAGNLPVFCIGGGHQLLNVVLGGTLIQHIPEEVPNAMLHEQETSRSAPCHPVSVTSGSLLHRVTGRVTFDVNSVHHQAVAAVGAGVVVTARAPDGVAEAIEAPGHRFVLGVQWAPEFRVTPADEALFAAFVEACRGPAPI